MNKRKEIYLALEFMVKTRQIILTDKDTLRKIARRNLKIYDEL